MNVTTSTPSATDLKRVRTRRLAWGCALVAVGFYVAFIVVSLIQGPR
jgi:hypothetical protein